MSRFTDLFQAPVSQPQPTPVAPKVEPKVEKVVEKVVPITKASDKQTKI